MLAVQGPDDRRLTAVAVTLSGVTNPPTAGARYAHASRPRPTPTRRRRAVQRRRARARSAGSRSTTPPVAPPPARARATSPASRPRLPAGSRKPANSQLDVTFPTGTTFPGWGGGRSRVGGIDVGSCYAPSGTHRPVLAVQRPHDRRRHHGHDHLRRRHQRRRRRRHGRHVATTSDPAGQTSPVRRSSPPTRSPAHGHQREPVSGGRRADAATSPASPPPATGGLARTANSQHRRHASPPGTTFAGWAGGTITVGGVDVGNCSAPSGLDVDCWLFTGRTIAADTAVTITFGGVTNPRRRHRQGRHGLHHLRPRAASSGALHRRRRQPAHAA